MTAHVTLCYITLAYMYMCANVNVSGNKLDPSRLVVVKCWHGQSERVPVESLDGRPEGQLRIEVQST